MSKITASCASMLSPRVQLGWGWGGDGVGMGGGGGGGGGGNMLPV